MAKKMTDTERKERKVHFAEKEEILGHDHEDGGEEESDDTVIAVPSDSDDEASSEYQSSLVDIRESMRVCVETWSQTPYWQLLEGCVDDDEGEAKDVQKYYVTFARIEIDGDCPRGLERQLCRSHHEARKAHYDAVTYAVLDADFRLRYENRGAKLSVDEIWTALRQVYKEHSRGSKALARKLGKADEAAVNRDPVNHEQAMHFIEDLKERTKKGLLHVKRQPSTSEPKSRRHSSSTRKSRTLDESSHAPVPSAKNKDKDRKAPLRIPSLTAMHRRKQKDHNDSFTAEDDNAADLFLEVDKKGKTKLSSTWRSLKKGISKRVQATGGGVNPRVH